MSLARELRQRHPTATIVIVEKEPQLGMHASGRNSGVLHSGIYYPPHTLKARLCRSGARQMVEFAAEVGVPVRRDGKVIVAVEPADLRGLDALMRNARASNICAERVDGDEIRRVEPHARAELGGIVCADTAVINPRSLLAALESELRHQGILIHTDNPVIAIRDHLGEAETRLRKYRYGVLINSAGAQADRIAQMVGAGAQYRLIPFKGMYYKLHPAAAHRIRGSIYPVPDADLPFLGVHFTRSIDGDVYIGPTVIPAIGRENYGVVRGAQPLEGIQIAARLARLYMQNPQNFRELVHREVPHYFRSRFVASALRLVDRFDPTWIEPAPKVGIRPQLLDVRHGRLEMDFVVERAERSVHILNAISPAFTSAFAFASFVADGMELN